MRYAQIVMGVKDSGKSTYCQMMAKYAEAQGRKMRIVNLDPTPGELPYEHPIADIRDVVKLDEPEPEPDPDPDPPEPNREQLSAPGPEPEKICEPDPEPDPIQHSGTEPADVDVNPDEINIDDTEIEELEVEVNPPTPVTPSEPAVSGFELAIDYITENPEWLFGSIGDLKDGDYILFDCAGASQFHIHSKSMKLFAAMLVVKSFRTCGVYVKDARMGLNGYTFISSSLTPLASYINLSIPNIGVMMKVDLLSDDDKSKLQLFINSDIKDVLRYENSKYKNQEVEGQAELAKLCSSAVTILDGHTMVRKKYFAMNIKDAEGFKSLLEIIDDLLGIIPEED